MPIIYMGNLTACTLLAVTVVPGLVSFISQARARLMSSPEMLRQKQRIMGLKPA